MNIEVLYFSMYVILVSVNLIYGLYSHKVSLVCTIGVQRKDASRLLALSLLIFLVIIASRDLNNPDYNSYYAVYVRSLDYDLGYNFIQDFFVSRGVEYHTFRVIIYCFSYFCVWNFLKQIDLNINFSIALYSIFPFFYDAIQLRNLLAFSVVLLFIPCLMSNKKRAVFIYVFAVIVATTIHKLSLIYLLLILVKMNNEEKKRKILIGVFVLSLLFLIMCKASSSFNTLLFSIFENITNDKRIVYVERKTVRFGYLLYILMSGLYLLSAFFSKKAAECEQQNVYERPAVKYSKFLFEINLLLCCTYPVFLISAEFYRIFRNISIINYFIPIINIRNRNRNSKQLVMISNCLFFLAFLLNWLYQTNVDGFSEVFWVFFD